MGKDRCIVHTSIGRVRGKMEKGVCSYKGVPFGKPLAPDTIFSPPEEVSTYPFTIDATRYGPIPFQRNMIGRETGLDCLNLNIWVPETGEGLLPVFFFVHGGSFFHGSGSESLYNGANLARQINAVVVTVNYRVGVFGFLDFSFLDSTFTANNGVRDVMCALSWVHHHIESFGGDPGNVTLTGQSAGGTLVSTILSIPQLKGMFARAVIMSGGPAQVQEKDECEEKSRLFLEYAGIHSAAELCSRDPKELRLVQKGFMKKLGQGSATFRITVDGDLIALSPLAAASRGLVHDVPLMIGTTESEMGFLAIKGLSRFINVEKTVQEGLKRESPEFIVRLKELYASIYGESRVIPMLYTDLIFKISSIWFAQALSEHGRVHLYRFDFETLALRMNGMHAIHSTDLPYLFGNFSSAIVRPMFLLQVDMESVHEVSRLIQEDLLSYMKGEEPGWPAIGGNSLFAKCYQEEPVYDQMIDPELASLYRSSEFYRSAHKPQELRDREDERSVN